MIGRSDLPDLLRNGSSKDKRRTALANVSNHFIFNREVCSQNEKSAKKGSSKAAKQSSRSASNQKRDNPLGTDLENAPPIQNIALEDEFICEGSTGPRLEAGAGDLHVLQNRSRFANVEKHHDDSHLGGAYACEIYSHLRAAETKRRPVVDYFETVQHDIDANMRAILVDWMVEVAEEYHLGPETLYLAVSYTDRFLSSNIVDRRNLQLVGVSCMLIAAKYEEICVPQVEEFCFITDHAYCREELLEMEGCVLDGLCYELTTPTIKTFLQFFVQVAVETTSHKITKIKLVFLANYLAELTLTEYHFLQYLPSKIAASAIFLARFTLDCHQHPWSATLQQYTGYRPADLEDCVKQIYQLQCNTDHQKSSFIREKYRCHESKHVANLFPPCLRAECFRDSKH